MVMGKAVAKTVEIESGGISTGLGAGTSCNLDIFPIPKKQESPFTSDLTRKKRERGRFTTEIDPT